jgi:TfoX/Sxy family transcriptional regulator of competence genes
VEIPKPSEDDKQFFRSLIADDPEVEIKPMFGNLGAFVHGNMFAGLFGSAVGVRLAEPEARDHVGTLPPKVKKPKKGSAQPR